jgi:hypothetical protein
MMAAKMDMARAFVLGAKSPCSWHQTSRPLLSATCLNTFKGVLRSTQDKIAYNFVERAFEA